jgi:hypothetical protein
MKKTASFLLVLFVWGSFGGVGFAIDPEDSFMSPIDDSPTISGCAEGQMKVDGVCVSDDHPMAIDLKNKNCVEMGSSNYVGWDSELKKCVTAQEVCESVGGFYENDKCISMMKHCHDEKQEYNDENNKCVPCEPGETFDAAVKICFDPSVTPSTIIPNTDIKETDCEKFFQYDSYEIGFLKDIVRGGVKAAAPSELKGFTKDNMISPLDVLGCAIKTGRIRLWMIPFYIKYLIQLALSLAGLVAVGAVVLGGYFYLFSSFADDKDKGKRAIIYGIVGFIVAMLSWTIVNVAMMILTR